MRTIRSRYRSWKAKLFVFFGHFLAQVVLVSLFGQKPLFDISTGLLYQKPAAPQASRRVNILLYLSLTLYMYIYIYKLCICIYIYIYRPRGGGSTRASSSRPCRGIRRTSWGEYLIDACVCVCRCIRVRVHVHGRVQSDDSMCV